MDNSKLNSQLRGSLKALLRASLEWLEAEQLKLLQDSPYSAASNAEVKLFAALRGKNRSISELSRYLGVSRQAVHQTVHKLIEKGVVRLEPIANNKRDKSVVITEAGNEARRVTAEHFRTIEKTVADNIGRENLDLLLQLLEQNLLKEQAKQDNSDSSAKRE